MDACASSTLLCVACWIVLPNSRSASILSEFLYGGPLMWGKSTDVSITLAWLSFSARVANDELACAHVFRHVFGHAFEV